MREMDFPENNLRNRWLGVKGIWKLLEGEVRRVVKVRLEQALVLEQRVSVGCGRYKRSQERRGYRNGSYVGYFGERVEEKLDLLERIVDP
ncbi:MAG: transposase [candidate division Zixibacteria bacterium]|nr:transposase [candidate division Zixibacteria bacterium]